MLRRPIETSALIVQVPQIDVRWRGNRHAQGRYYFRISKSGNFHDLSNSGLSGS